MNKVDYARSIVIKAKSEGKAVTKPQFVGNEQQAAWVYFDGNNFSVKGFSSYGACATVSGLSFDDAVSELCAVL